MNTIIIITIIIIIIIIIITKSCSVVLLCTRNSDLLPHRHRLEAVLPSHVRQVSTRQPTLTGIRMSFSPHYPIAEGRAVCSEKMTRHGWKVHVEIKCKVLRAF